jgi:two-component sensor histidine kinase
LISNALKHAFPNGNSGQISIHIERVADGWVCLQVGDNGVGFPPGLNFNDSPSLGLQLVHSLVSQLDGSIELEQNGGSNIRIRFPLA